MDDFGSAPCVVHPPTPTPPPPVVYQHSMLMTLDRQLKGTGCSLSALFWTHNYFTSVTSLSPSPGSHHLKHTNVCTHPRRRPPLPRQLCLEQGASVHWAVTRPQRWAFSCQDKHCCHNKPGSQLWNCVLGGDGLQIPKLNQTGRISQKCGWKTSGGQNYNAGLTTN